MAAHTRCKNTGKKDAGAISANSRRFYGETRFIACGDAMNRVSTVSPAAPSPQILPAVSTAGALVVLEAHFSVYS